MASTSKSPGRLQKRPRHRSLRPRTEQPQLDANDGGMPPEYPQGEDDGIDSAAAAGRKGGAGSPAAGGIDYYRQLAKDLKKKLRQHKNWFESAREARNNAFREMKPLQDENHRLEEKVKELEADKIALLAEKNKALQQVAPLEEEVKALRKQGAAKPQQQMRRLEEKVKDLEAANVTMRKTNAQLSQQNTKMKTNMQLEMREYAELRSEGLAWAGHLRLALETSRLFGEGEFADGDLS
ncbi:hypothetical protein B0A55_07333 [Friedmanniomyces simplex]|uniref:Uncharacterized protein n=1 Tax=Friedmanniomyces simplex TaxID=329884 RepID=A0A4U0X4D4_9PEZI|nr:hypothetical protein B0A55_07333 [Friedmanniomyces simplex]